MLLSGNEGTGVVRDRCAKRGLSSTGQGCLLSIFVARNIRSINNHFNEELIELKCPFAAETATEMPCTRGVVHTLIYAFCQRKQSDQQIVVGNIATLPASYAEEEEC